MPTYTPNQLTLYLQRIQHPSPNLQHLTNSITHNPLSTLSTLQKHHLSSIPWGNSALHYSQHRSISVHPQTVFEKLVTRRLDGYCMESTGLFLGVLRSLGYRVYATAGRVSRSIVNGRGGEGLYKALAHMVLIVTIDDEKYMVDVGFGNDCATTPLPLKENLVLPCISPAEMRLIKDTIIEFTDPSRKLWIYQTRYNPETPWTSKYCFSEIEYLPQDFAVMNLYVSQSPSSFFTQVVMCTRMILDDKDGNIMGQCILSGNEVKRRVRGQTEVLETLKSEDDRVRALARWFDIHLRDDEVQGIRGLVSQLVV